MIARRPVRVSNIADWLGIAASTACVIHCTLLPLLVVAGALIPSALPGDEAFHRFMLGIVVPVALVAFGLGCWRHKDRWVLALGGAGLAGMVMAATVLHDIAGESGERLVTLVAAAMLITAHYRNTTLCRSADRRPAAS